MPIARMMAAGVRVSEHSKNTRPGRRQLTCAACGVHAKPTRQKVWKDVRVFGLPVFTWKRTFVDRCPSCKKEVARRRAVFVEAALWWLL